MLQHRLWESTQNQVFPCLDNNDELPGSSYHTYALSQWKWRQGVTHCYEFLLNNVKTASSYQISSLRVSVAWRQHSSLSGSRGASARCTSVSETQDWGEHDRATSPPVEGKVYCLSNLCMPHLKLWLMQVKVCDWCFVLREREKL